jgi:nicotinamidase/pyrazinamidase
MPRAFLDIDTQVDFMLPAGALYGKGAERIIPTVARLNHFAVANGIPLISTACAHSEDDPEFRSWPPHCVVGCLGQKKPAALLAGQEIFEKQTTNMFEHPAAAGLIAGLGADEFVVYGVFTEVCVMAAANGLLDRGYRVAVVRDAVQHLNPSAADAFWKNLRDRGGRIVESSEVLTG